MEHEHAVFISYCRRGETARVLELQNALGSDLVFLDRTDLRHGEAFPAALFEAEVSSRVIVCFLDKEYWQSPFCQIEWAIATEPEQPGPPPRSTRDHLVIVLPSDPSQHKEVTRWLPPDLAAIHWPTADEIGTIGKLVRHRLSLPACQPVRKLLGDARTSELRSQMQDLALMPSRRRPPDNRLLVGVPGMPKSEFFGRAHLLADMLRRLSSVEGQASVALIGPGGIGKTRLALEFLWRYVTELFPGGAVWVDASRPESREQQLYAILQRLEERVPSLADMQAAGMTLESRLREELEQRFTNQGLLWIIDQLPEAVPGEPGLSIEDWCPAGSANIATIITSRSRQMPLVINLEVGGLHRPDAVRFLEDELPEGLGTTSEWWAVAEAVGDWPLALELLNRCFATQVLTPAAFLESQRIEGAAPVLDEAISIVQELMPDGALRGLGATFLATLERLPEGARQLALTLSQYGDAEIPTVVLDALGPQIAGPRNKVALLTRSIVTGGGGQVFGRIQPLFADFLRRMPEAASSVDAAAEVLHRLIPKFAPEVPTGWEQANQLAPLVDAIRQRSGVEALIQLSLSDWLARLRIAEGQYAAARTTMLQLVELATAQYGLTHADTLALRARLADLLLKLGEIREARALFEQLHAEQTALHGALAADTLLAQVHLGHAAQAAGSPISAELLLQDAVAKAHEVLGAEHRVTIEAGHELGIVLLRLGRHADAVTMAERVLDQRIALLGATHRETLQARNTLAVIRLNQGALDEAGAMFQELQSALSHTLGEDHPETLLLRHNLALVLKRQGRWAESRQQYEEVVARRSRVLGVEHPGTLGSRNNLAGVYFELGDLAAALECFDQVLTVQQRRLPPEHPALLRTRYNLASVLTAQGAHARALEILKSNLPAKEQVLGPTHPETEMDRTLLAEIEEALRTGAS